MASNVIPSGLRQKALEKITAISATEIALLGASLSYVSGFVITNVHLAYMGVVSVELIRLRYVATGFLFLSFLALIAVLVYGALRLLRDHEEEGVEKTLGSFAFYTGSTFAGLFIGAYLLDYLIGKTVASPIEIPDYFILETWWRQWNFWVISVLLGILIVLGSVIYGYFTQRKKTPDAWLAGSIPDIAWPTLLIGTYVLALFLLAFMTVLPGWTRFVLGAFVIYLLLLLWKVFPIVHAWLRDATNTQTRSAKPPSKTHPILRLARDAVWIILLPVGLFIIYQRIIYPTMPQQLGGGSLLLVTAAVTSDRTSAILTNPSYTVYLVDRTSDDTIFHLIPQTPISQTSTLVPTILQIPNDDIESLTYKR
ncbi:MAG: hypothetical protein WCD37_01940 [Chloroflexia bacterium]